MHDECVCPCVPSQARAECALGVLGLVKLPNRLCFSLCVCPCVRLFVRVCVCVTQVDIELLDALGASKGTVIRPCKRVCPFVCMCM